MYTNSCIQICIKIICKIYKHIRIWKYFLKSLESLKSFLLIFYNSIEMVKIIMEILLGADQCINLDILAKEWQGSDTVIFFNFFSIRITQYHLKRPFYTIIL